MPRPTLFSCPDFRLSIKVTFSNVSQYLKILNINQPQGSTMQDADVNQIDTHPERPWIALNTTYDIEAWIDSYNRDLQYAMKKTNATGYGICFFLELGGEIFLHTTQEGDVMLDVTPEAAWVAP